MQKEDKTGAELAREIIKLVEDEDTKEALAALTAVTAMVVCACSEFPLREVGVVQRALRAAVEKGVGLAEQG